MGIDPHGGPRYSCEEMSWQEARDVLAMDIGLLARCGTSGGRGPGRHATPWIRAWQDERLLLIDVGTLPDGELLALVVDVVDKVLWTGGPLTEVLSTGYWEHYDGGPDDWAVVSPLIDGLPQDLAHWEDWFDSQPSVEASDPEEQTEVTDEGRRGGNAPSADDRWARIEPRPPAGAEASGL